MIRSLRNGKIHLQFIRSKSAQAASKPAFKDDGKIPRSEEASERSLENSKDNEEIKISEETSKLPKRDPLVKNFFLGIADKELLAYPEVIPRDEMQKLKNEQIPIENFFSQIIDAKNDATRKIPTDILANLKELGWFGLNVPQQYRGKDWQMSASLIASESENLCPNVAMSLLSHRSIIDALNNSATEEQRQRYMEKLATGKTIATEAIFELKSSNLDLFTTKAEFVPEMNVWLLNGEKFFVINGANAEILLVIAQTRNASPLLGTSHHGLTVFLVDSSKEGIKIGERQITLGLRGVELTSIKFDNVKLSNDCIFGEANRGDEIGELILRYSRLRSSQIAFGIAKDCIRQLANFSIDNENCGVPLMNMDMMKNVTSKGVCEAYAMESMIYFTAGLIDEFNGQDVALESAITKYYAYSRLLDIATRNLNFFGPKSLLSGEPTEIAFRNAIQLFAMGEPINTLKVFIALAGFQHAGVNLASTIMKTRNPLYHPFHILKKYLEPENLDHPRTKMRLCEHLHPALEAAAQCLEYNLVRLRTCVEILLSRYGSEVMNKHADAHRITEMATITYSMFASLSRASRSYCIGLPLADHEMLLATAICCHGNEAVKTLSKEISNGIFINNDRNLERLSKQVFKSRGYFAVNPLMYNF